MRSVKVEQDISLAFSANLLVIGESVIWVASPLPPHLPPFHFLTEVYLSRYWFDVDTGHVLKKTCLCLLEGEQHFKAV